jgi:hypothetical protein
MVARGLVLFPASHAIAVRPDPARPLIIAQPGNSKRHPLNSADGSVVRHTKRYTLTRRVATATTQITIRGIPRHGKLKISDYSLLAQFGLTPKRIEQFTATNDE